MELAPPHISVPAREVLQRLPDDGSPRTIVDLSTEAHVEIGEVRLLARELTAVGPRLRRTSQHRPSRR
jgi:hypothetical protein